MFKFNFCINSVCLFTSGRIAADVNTTQEGKQSLLTTLLNTFWFTIPLEEKNKTRDAVITPPGTPPCPHPTVALSTELIQ